MSKIEKRNKEFLLAINSEELERRHNDFTVKIRRDKRNLDMSKRRALASESENALKGKTVSEATFRQAAEVAMQGAKAFKHNQYKLKLGPNTIVQALSVASGLKTV